MKLSWHILMRYGTVTFITIDSTVSKELPLLDVVWGITYVNEGSPIIF